MVFQINKRTVQLGGFLLGGILLTISVKYQKSNPYRIFFSLFLKQKKKYQISNQKIIVIVGGFFFSKKLKNKKIKPKKC